MQVTTYPTARDFLAAVQTTLEANEALHSLVLGVCMHLARLPEPPREPPYLAAVWDQERLALAAMMIPSHNLVLAPTELADDRALAALAEDLQGRQRGVPGVQAPVPHARRFAEIWCERRGCRCQRIRRLAILALEEVIPPRPAPGHLRSATQDEIPQVTEWLLAFQQEALPEEAEQEEARRRIPELARRVVEAGRLFLWDHQGPVSMVALSRPTRHGVTINMVYTPPEHRGRGYASNAVARLSQRLLDEGYRFCTLFVDLANPISTRLYRSIGYHPVAEVEVYRFQPAALPNPNGKRI